MSNLVYFNIDEQLSNSNYVTLESITDSFQTTYNEVASGSVLCTTSVPIDFGTISNTKVIVLSTESDNLTYTLNAGIAIPFKELVLVSDVNLTQDLVITGVGLVNYEIYGD